MIRTITLLRQRALQACARYPRLIVHHPNSTHAPRRRGIANVECRRLTPIGLLGKRGFASSSRWEAIVPFKLHDIGEGITEVEMLQWKVVEGQLVDHFDELCEVQSDKSTAELTSPTPGVIHAIYVAQGDTVKVGTTLCDIRTDEPGGQEDTHQEEVESPRQTGSSSPQQQVEEAILPPPPTLDAASLQPEAAVQEEGFQREEAVDEHPRPHEEDMSTGVQFSGEASILPSAPASTSSFVAREPLPPRRERQDGSPRHVILSSPAVRTLAARLGVDLADVNGSGDKGRVTRDDVEAYAKQGSVSTPALSPAPATSAQPQSSGRREEWEDLTKVPFGRTRKVMYRALGAQGNVPHFGQVESCRLELTERYSHTLDLTPLVPYLRALNATSGGDRNRGYLAADIPSSLVGDPTPPSPPQKTTLLTLLVKAMILAMQEHPIMRAKVVGEDKERTLEIRKDGVIGVAVSDPKYGLVTPSLPPLPPTASLSSITAHLATLRANGTKPGPSSNLIISSVGGLGESTGAMPVLPPNGAIAICAVGRAKWEVEWEARDGGFKMDATHVENAGTRAVLRVPVGWSGDHRVLEGAELIAFTESWKRWIERPEAGLVNLQ